MDLSFVHSKTIQLVEMTRKGEKTHAFISATTIMDEYEAVVENIVHDKDTFV